MAIEFKKVKYDIDDILKIKIINNDEPLSIIKFEQIITKMKELQNDDNIRNKN